MKKIVLSAIAVIFSMFLFSCGGSSVSEADLLGAWKVETAEISNLDELVETMAGQFGVEGEDEIEEMKVKMEKGMNEEFVGSDIEFLEDKTVKVSDEDRGTWSFNADENKIEIVDGDKKIDFVVNGLNGGELDATLVIHEDEMDIELALTLARQ